MSLQTFHSRRRKRLLLACVIAAVVSVGVGVGLTLKGKAPSLPEAEIRERLVRYSFMLENDKNELLEDVVFKAFAPVKTTPFQQVERIEASSPYQIESDDLGNQTLVFHFDRIPPYGRKVISISVWLKTADGPTFNAPFHANEFLSPLVEPDDQSLIAAMEAIGDSDDVLEWLQSANQWVHQTLEDVGYVAEDRGAQYALREKKGDCTEFAHALMALSRINGVPTMFVAGFPVHGHSSILQASGYHNWVLTNVEGRWRLADPHVGGFELGQQRYIAFRIPPVEPGTDVNSQRFFSYDSRVRARMN